MIHDFSADVDVDLNYSVITPSGVTKPSSEEQQEIINNLHKKLMPFAGQILYRYGFFNNPYIFDFLTLIKFMSVNKRAELQIFMLFPILTLFLVAALHVLYGLNTSFMLALTLAYMMFVFFPKTRRKLAERCFVFWQVIILGNKDVIVKSNEHVKDKVCAEITLFLNQYLLEHRDTECKRLMVSVDEMCVRIMVDKFIANMKKNVTKLDLIKLCFCKKYVSKNRYLFKHKHIAACENKGTDGALF